MIYQPVDEFGFNFDVRMQILLKVCHCSVSPGYERWYRLYVGRCVNAFLCKSPGEFKK